MILLFPQSFETRASIKDHTALGHEYASKMQYYDQKREHMIAKITSLADANGHGSLKMGIIRRLKEETTLKGKSSRVKITSKKRRA